MFFRQVFFTTISISLACWIGACKLDRGSSERTAIGNSNEVGTPFGKKAFFAVKGKKGGRIGDPSGSPIGGVRPDGGGSPYTGGTGTNTGDGPPPKTVQDYYDKIEPLVDDYSKRPEDEVDAAIDKAVEGAPSYDSAFLQLGEQIGESGNEVYRIDGNEKEVAVMVPQDLRGETEISYETVAAYYYIDMAHDVMPDLVPDVGNIVTSNDLPIGYTMDYVPGNDVNDLTPAQIEAMGRDNLVSAIEGALGTMHENGIPHGDFHGGNIRVDYDPLTNEISVQVIDLIPASDGEMESQMRLDREKMENMIAKIDETLAGTGNSSRPPLRDPGDVINEFFGR